MDMMECTEGAHDRSMEYIIIMPDVDHKKLNGTISRVLQTDYLSASETTSWPVSGVVWGPQKRMLFCLPVTVTDKSINVHFVLDTCSPFTYISHEVVTALDIEPWQLAVNVTRVNGVRSMLKQTPKKTSGDNLRMHQLSRNNNFFHHT
jgi:hypothetical protein